MAYENVLKEIPNLFEINLNIDKDGSAIFERLLKIIDFDEGFIYFLNPKSLQLKYGYKKHSDYKIDYVYNIDDKLNEKIYQKNGVVLTSNSEFIKDICLQKFDIKSYLIAKLAIKSTVFGIILLGKKEQNFYSEKDLTVLNAASGILSYILKDLELSNVFRLQLKALKDGLIEKNEAYKTIKKQNEQILESEKAKNEFLANISHELRTPLNSILGFSELLSSNINGELSPKQSEFVNDIKFSATHLLGIINEILDISKLEANAMKLVKSRFSISLAINEVCNIILPLAEKKHIKIIKKLNNDFEINADYQKIQQILFNLTSNAIKFSEEDSHITISAEIEGKNAILTVQDNGIGIDEKYHGKIFAKFVQLDSAYTKKESSTGLGLAITKELAELHGGSISIKSEIGKGSTFIVKIPLG